MPPKPKFTREQIIQTALELVSEKGIEGLTARELGAALGSSARPIFTVFQNMEELQGEVRKAAMARFESYAEHTLTGMSLFKQVGIQMILFGIREPKLYQLLFMQENHNAHGFVDVFGVLGPMAQVCIRAIEEDYGLTDKQAGELFENMWVYTFGLGALCATKVCSFSQEQLGRMLSTQFQAMMDLLRSEE